MNIQNFKFPTCIQQITHDQSPVNGQFFIGGSIPVACLDENRRSQIYPTLAAAEKAIQSDGVTRWQKPDCTWGETCSVCGDGETGFCACEPATQGKVW